MTRALVPDDLLRLRVAQSPTVCSDGRIAFAVQESDGEHDERLSSIWLADTSGVRRFTAGDKDAAPRFAPDGAALAFVRAEGEHGRIHVLPVAGGEAQAVGEPRDGISALRWSPDGRRLAFVAKAEAAPEAGVFRDERSGARHIRTLLYKSDEEGLSDGRRRHLFVADVARGSVEQITRGEFDAGAPCWSPDGRELTFSAQIDLPETSFRSDVWVVDVAAGTLRKLTQSLGWTSSPAFSHDGRWVAYAGHEHGEDGPGGARNLHLYLVPREGGVSRCVDAQAFDGLGDHVITDTRGHGNDLIVWSEDDSAVFSTATIEGATYLVRIGVRDGAWTRVAGGAGRTILAADVGHDRIAFVASDPRTPSEVYCSGLDGGSERQLTDLNPWLAEVELAEPERVRPAHRDGTVLDLWLLRPARAAAPYPLVFEVHGGPHASFGPGFFFEFQMLAGQGYAVAYGNIRGSQSYGEPFARAIVGRWGTLDAEDALTLLDAALERLPADPARVAVAGGSYGGFMTSLLMGKAPERFACGISMRAVNAMISMIGTSDFGWFIEQELEASLLDAEIERLYAASPISLAHAYRSPLLILHSERDYRCPLGQGEELFHLLRRLGKPVEMVRFERDAHGLSRDGHPRNRVLRLRAIANWLAQWLREPRGPAREAGWLFAPL
ncbi:S9 family peptidase [bacterium]|nr:MAG: S9 family peptidase [bacterium]